MKQLNLFEFYFKEDCPYFDETTELLGIQGEGIMRIITREKGVSACTEELAEFLKSKGLKIDFLPSGSAFKAKDTILTAEGNLKMLFRVWRVSQTFLSITCAIATATKKLVEKAKAVNPNVILATTRKTHPGMRYFELKAVRSGGGDIHRNSLSDSILITQNHLRIIGQFEKIRALKKIELEPRTVEEAIEYAKIVDMLLLDHFTPEKLEELIPRLRRINPKLKIAVTGNINEHNIREYARLVDVIISSAPYYVKPLDLTTRIESD
ncbi:MAG: nicotinate-nucleotide pyrophosphorylase [Archaeoglobus sp.]|nr:MAG: nicotinate-nucleotide pyrophosphorylase [Archaeoglobus sp.]